MSAKSERTERFAIELRKIDLVVIEEVFRLGVLRDGIQLSTTSMRFPILGQVVPRVELELFSPTYHKKVTVRVNQASPFIFTGEELRAHINGEARTLAARQFVDDERAPTGMYNFGLMRENGVRSFVFDYHTYCAFSCDYCFKESEWEILAVEGVAPRNYNATFEECLDYVSTHADDFASKYDIVWLCTGSITNEELELKRHCLIASALRDVGYSEGIYVSQVIPPSIRSDETRRREYLERLKESGISRFNSGIEIVNTDFRKKYIHGYKGTLTFEDYLSTFSMAVEIFGRHNVGSCLLAGIEPARDTLGGLAEIAELGVVPSPTVLTPFVTKQDQIIFQYDLDGLIDVHVQFNEIIEKHDLPVFSGVFSLA